MFTNRSIKVLVLAVIGLIVVVGLAAAASTALGQGPLDARGHTIAIEVAENGTRFVVDETPAFEEDGLPAYGAEFITEGYLYPAGTLTCADNQCNGVLEDGSPEFPDEVLGRWVCRGWFVGDGFHTMSGPVVVTTQIYDLGDTPGTDMIVTDGYELVDFNVPLQRAITGGSGPYRNARGEQTQEFLGLNPGMGVALRVELNVIGR